ncbi:MAG: hypothetical protein ABI602_02990 [Candidatus Saccharibacteria bacterium]
MASSEKFDKLLNDTALDIYNRTVIAADAVPPRANLSELGKYFAVEISPHAHDDLSPLPNLHRLTVTYSPIPRTEDEVGVRPVLCFEYDQFGELSSLEHWVDDNADNGEVRTIYHNEAGEYKEDVVLAGDEADHLVAAIFVHLNPTVSFLFDSNAMANYELEKQLLQTGHPLTATRIAQLIPMLKQAKADLTYLPSQT